MSDRHIITVWGSPVAQGRPRFFRRGEHVGTYDPPSSKYWKMDVQRQVLDALGGKPEIHFGPIKMTVKFYMPRPKSLPKKITHHIKKPDVDNLVKAIKDANKGILFRDDSQIVELTVTKDYNATPRVVIALEVLE